MTHPFDKHLQRTGHHPRLKIPNGVQQLTITFTPGYVHIKTSHPYGGEIYITASTIRRALKRGLFSKMLAYHVLQDRSFDVPRAQQTYARAEAQHLAELRRQKRQR